MIYLINPTHRKATSLLKYMILQSYLSQISDAEPLLSFSFLQTQVETCMQGWLGLCVFVWQREKEEETFLSPQNSSRNQRNQIYTFVPWLQKVTLHNKDMTVCFWNYLTMGVFLLFV